MESDSQNAPTLEQRTNEKITTINFCPENVQKHLEKLKVTKSPGPDQMHPKFLHETAKEISIPLAKIFNTSLKNKKKKLEEGKCYTTP